MSRNKTIKVIDDLKYTVLKLLRQGEGYTIDGLSNTMHIPEDEVKRILANLTADGFIKFIKDSESGNTYYIDKDHLDRMKASITAAIEQTAPEDTSYIR